jgi:lipopolysaccharide transport system ATP-binding protein
MALKSLTIEDLSKRYWIPRAQTSAPDRSRFERLKGMFSRPSGDLSGDRELWALRNATFDVEHGSVLGLIGANGAGKSTLLKIIAKVVAPTSGRVRGRGRVVSLLELGAGFDEEATARENVYMNAAMNGISRADVDRRFDDIIGFAEMQEFVDTPLMYYSSGMYLRLAFSVAINMDPAILLADEILAVGDIAFQERCLQKVHELARKTGLTVLFVSHDMEAISRICDRVIWINSGTIFQDGDPEEIVTAYQNSAWKLLSSGTGSDYKGRSHASRYGEIVDVKLLSADGREIGSPPRFEDVFVRIRFRTYRAKTRARCAFDLYTKGVLVLRSAQPELTQVAPDNSYEAVARIPASFLSETTYSISAGVTLIRGEGEEHALVVNKALNFMVYGEHGVEGSSTLHRTGVVDPRFEWKMAEETSAVRA